MSDSEEDYDGNGYSSEEGYGGGGYSSEDYGGEGYSSEEENHGGGCSSKENCSSGGGGYSCEDIDPDEEYYGGQDETDPGEEDSRRYESEDEIAKGRPNFGSYEFENTSKFQYKDNEDAKNYSAKFTDGYKAQDFAEKHTGNPGFKEEVNYKSYCKVDDKIGGLKTEYETQVKTTKKVTVTKTCNTSKNSSSYAVPDIHSSFKRLNAK